MDCTTKHINPISLLEEDKPKKKFATQEDAIAHCKRMNAIPSRIHKVVSYKCPVCHTFHVGRNGKLLTQKYVGNLVKQKEQKANRGFKIVGFIEL